MIPEEPVRGSFAYLDHPGLLGMPGLEQLKPFVRGELPPPPIHHLSGLRPVEAGPGTATYSMPASPWWQSAAGPFLGGTYAFVADAPLGSAIYTTLPKGSILATSELSMNFLRPATPASETLIARGEVIQLGRAQGLSEARVEDAGGRLLAHATSRCVLSPLPFDPPELPDPLPRWQPPSFDSPDPHARPPEGEVLPQEAWDSASGLELMLGWCQDHLPHPPVTRLTGWRPTDVAEGSSTWTMPANRWFCSSHGMFYGGAVAIFADVAINGAVTSIVPPATSYGTLDLKINFLRPVTPDGRDLTARARVVHRGRRIAVVTADVEDADGRRVAMATSSAMLLPGRPWLRARPALDETAAENDPGG